MLLLRPATSRLAPSYLQMTTEEQRLVIRKEMLDKRSQLSASQLDSAGDSLANRIEKISSDWKKPATNTDDPITVAGYLAIGGEIPLDESLSRLRQQGMSTCVPVIQGDKMRFAPLTDDTVLVTGKYGIKIPEYNTDELLDASALTVILAPLVAFDNSGNRIGMGGGYYDRTFAHLHPDQDNGANNTQSQEQKLIGVAHDFQNLDSVPVESWDVPLKMVITDHNTYLFAARENHP